MNDPETVGRSPAYYPGYEPLWIGGGNIARAQVRMKRRDCVKYPVADGAEASTHVTKPAIRSASACPTERQCSFAS